MDTNKIYGRGSGVITHEGNLPSQKVQNTTKGTQKKS